MNSSLSEVEPHQSALASERRLTAVVMAAFAFVLFASCISPTVTFGGDCGELIAASWRLGIAHPTGYPLYLLLGRTFASLFPFGEAGLRYNLLSALLGACAVGLVTATVHRLVSQGDDGVAYSVRGDRPFRVTSAAGAGALLSGFYFFSSQSVIAEVYALNALMLSGLLYCALAWHQSGYERDRHSSAGDVRWAYMVAVLAGLALNAHLSCIFLAPGILLYVLLQHRSRFAMQGGMGRHLCRMALLFCAAYALTLYLPARSAGFPPPSASQGLQTATWWPLDWTHPADLKNWLAHVTAKQYKHLLWQRYEIELAGHGFQFTWFRQPLLASVARFFDFSTIVLVQFFWCVPLLFIGAIASCNNAVGSVRASGGRWLGLLLWSGFCFNVALEINYGVGDISNFFFPAYIVSALWLGIGIARALTFFKRQSISRAESASVRKERALNPVLSATSLMVLWAGSTFVLQWSKSLPMINHRGDTSARDMALRRAGVVEEVAKGTGKAPSVALMTDDALWSFWYVRYVLGRAPDCITPWGTARNRAVDAGTFPEMVENWYQRGPVILSRWEDAVDLKHPLTMLTSEGDLCLLSSRTLPPAAEVLQPTTRLAPWTIARAAFRERARRDPAEPELPPAVVLQRSDMAAFELDFALGAAAPLSQREAGAPAIAPSDSPPSAHAGYLEVYMARAGRFKTISPTQADVRIDSTLSPPLAAWRQRRRIIVPLELTRAPRTQLLRLSTPLQMDVNTALGRYNVWVRLVRSKGDQTTAWKRVGDVVLK